MDHGAPRAVPSISRPVAGGLMLGRERLTLDPPSAKPQWVRLGCSGLFDPQRLQLSGVNALTAAGGATVSEPYSGVDG